MICDIRAHLTHRLSIALAVATVYCRDCDLYLDHLSTIAIEVGEGRVQILVLTPSHQEGVTP